MTTSTYDEHGRERGDDVARDHARLAPGGARGEPVGGRGGGGGEARLDALGEEGREDAGEHVAGAGGREPRRVDDADERAPRRARR